MPSGHPDDHTIVPDAPCDTCPDADRCASCRLACMDFLRYAKLTHAKRHATDRVPTRAGFRAAFHERKPGRKPRTGLGEGQEPGRGEKTPYRASWSVLGYG